MTSNAFLRGANCLHSNGLLYSISRKSFSKAPAKTFSRRSFASSRPPDAGSSSNPVRMHPKERAEKVHAELEKMVKQNELRHEEEKKKARSQAGFNEFLRKNRTNVSIIAISFLTVFLSFKIVQNKHKYERLSTEKEDIKKKLDHGRTILQSLKKKENLTSIANKCATDIVLEQSIPQGRGGFGWRTSSASLDEESIASIIAPILEKELEGLIGTASLNEQELKEYQEKQGSIQQLSKLSEQLEIPTELAAVIESSTAGDSRVVKKKEVFRI